MGILTALFAPPVKRSTPRYGGISTLASPDEWLRRFFGGDRSSSGIRVNPDRAMQATAVYACVRLRAQSIAMLPLNVYKRTSNGREVDTNHYLYPLLHSRPNQEQNSFEFREMGQAHLDLRGNFFAQKRKRGTKVKELIPLHPDRVQVVREQGEIIYKYHAADGVVTPMTRDQVLHLKAMSLDGVTGLSQIQLGMNAIGLALATEQFGALTFSQRATMAGALKHQSNISKAAADRLKESIAESYSGLDNSHGLILLEEGMDYVSLGMRNDEAQFLETRKFQLAEIARLFGIPNHMINDLERATFSNIEQQSIDFVIYSLLAWLRRWEQGLSQQLLTEEEMKTHYIGFVLEGLLRGDTLSRYQAYAAGRQWGWLCADDIREREDMNFLPDGQGQIFVTPMNMDPATLTLFKQNHPEQVLAPPAPPSQNEPAKPAEDPKKGEKTREKQVISVFLEDGIARITRKESLFVSRSHEKWKKRGIADGIDEFRASCDDFAKDHEQFIIDVLSPVVQGVSLLIEEDQKRWLAEYASVRTKDFRHACHGSPEEVARHADLLKAGQSSLVTTELTTKLLERIAP